MGEHSLYSESLTQPRQIDLLPADYQKEMGIHCDNVLVTRVIRVNGVMEVLRIPNFDSRLSSVLVIFTLSRRVLVPCDLLTLGKQSLGVVVSAWVRVLRLCYHCRRYHIKVLYVVDCNI